MAKFMPHKDIESSPEALYYALRSVENHAIGVGIELDKITSYRAADNVFRYKNI